MNFKERISAAPLRQWIKWSIAEFICIGFVIWSQYYLVLILVPLLFDSYILKYIPWAFWRNSGTKASRKGMEWIDSISFALVAVYFINTFFFQNYQIPSSSLEKSLLVGDFLCVSKMSYGSRSPMTPFSFPLVQHTFPILNCKSYLDRPQIAYKRLAGFGHVKRGDIVVFNFPAGDTVSTKISNPDYYTLCMGNPGGRKAVWADKTNYGDIVYRPVDRRENFVKRCVGLPGDTLQIIDDVIYNNGVKFEDSENIEHNYIVQSNQALSDKLFDELGVSNDDTDRALDIGRSYVQGLDSLQLTQLGLNLKKGLGVVYYLPLTKKMVKTLREKPFVLGVTKQMVGEDSRYYPLGYKTHWTISNYGKIWIPKRGSTITFDTDVDYKVAAYSRCIRNYEHNTFDYRDGKVYVNGKQVDSYTFNYDYYWMMGDNRDNSEDSRYWGFVPEDHIVGQPMFVWLSLNKDKGLFSGMIRWNRLFTSAKKN